MRPAVWLCRKIKDATGCKTWHVESSFVGLVLAAVVFATGRSGQWVEWLGAAAVWLTFGHASIGFRLQEAEEKRTEIHVACHKKLKWYFLGKEACWLLYFIMLGAWSALVGVFVFLIYPWWRFAWLQARSGPQAS